MLESVFRILPATLAAIIDGLVEASKSQLEEIRIRENRPLEIVVAGKFSFVARDGSEVSEPSGAYRPSKDDCMRLLDKLSNHSLYTLEEELRRGYITVRGGHRVGIAGRTVLERGAIRQMKDITCFNVRIARELPGIASKLLPKLIDPAVGTIHPTLLLSPPGRGKTTLLRDIARSMSYGRLLRTGVPRAVKVGIVDERSELAACVDGVPSFDVGPRTDVLDGCPKADGMMMMIRSMSPDVLVVDEIGRAEDTAGLHEAMLSGVRVIASAHASDLTQARHKPILRELMTMKLFTRYVVLGERTVGNADLHVFDDKYELVVEPVAARVMVNRRC